MAESDLERNYQKRLTKKIRKRMPECIVLKNDSGYQQGIPDLSVLCPTGWAFLEVKREEGAEEQPNQRWFVERAAEQQFGAFIYPDNEEDILNDLQRKLGPRG